MRKLLFGLTLFLLCGTAVAQLTPWGGPASAYGYAGLSSSDVWSVRYNQAGLANIESFQTGVAYQSPFLLNELGTGQLIAAMPVGDGAFGLAVQNRGFSLYREGLYGIGYGRKLSESFNMGIQINYFTLQLGEGYGSVSTFTVEGGFTYDLTQNLSIAGHVYNPNQSKLEDSGDQLPAFLKGGIAYRFSDKVQTSLEVWKHMEYDAEIHAGISYRAAEVLSLGVGIQSNPGSIYGGFGLHFGDLEFGVATLYHNVLGYSPQLSLTYRGS